MDGYVGHTHLGLEAVRLGHVAVAGVDHERRTQLARVDDALHLGVAAVVSAHEADLHQALAVRALGRDDLLAVGGVLCQRLFAEDVLAILEPFEHIARVRRVGGGDQDGLDVRGGDELLAGGVGANAILGCNLVCGLLEVVGAANDFCAGHQVVQAADMVAADGAAADNTNFEHSFQDPFWDNKVERPAHRAFFSASMIDALPDAVNKRAAISAAYPKSGGLFWQKHRETTRKAGAPPACNVQFYSTSASRSARSEEIWPSSMDRVRSSISSDTTSS